LIAIILVSPLILLSKLGMVFKSEMLFVGCTHILSLVPDYAGSYLRVAFYTYTLPECSFTGHIRFGTFISRPQARIGANFYIGANNIIGLAHIGKNVVIANNINVMSGRRQHNFADPSQNIMEVEDNFEPVKIGDNVFIGDRAVIMADVGDYSIIGAGSVVVKEVPPYSVAVGNPAKVIEKRDETKS
jgi:acetyltransferase-like isoleucine patch superfamily enzyme